MTYVRKGGLIYSINDNLVPKYTSNGFSVFIPKTEKIKEETQKPKEKDGDKNAKESK